MYSALFLKNPVEFASDYAILPDLGLEDPENLKPKVVDSNLTVYQVKGGNRILFAKIVAKPGAHRCCEVEFNPAQATADWFPVYWLPWQYNKTYRITLKPSEKTKIKGKDEEVVDPHVFFTAALTGCLVHVDGDPFQPTVYHSNARDLKHKPAPSRDEMMLWSMKIKASAMSADAAAAQKAHPKSKSVYKPQSATSLQYQPHSASPKLQDELQQKAMAKLKAEIVQPAYLGMVFGIKDDTHGWSFYYQSLIQFRIQKNSKKYELWLVRACKRFWPGAD